MKEKRIVSQVTLNFLFIKTDQSCTITMKQQMKSLLFASAYLFDPYKNRSQGSCSLPTKITR